MQKFYLQNFFWLKFSNLWYVVCNVSWTLYVHFTVYPVFMYTSLVEFVKIMDGDRGGSRLWDSSPLQSLNYEICVYNIYMYICTTTTIEHHREHMSTPPKHFSPSRIIVSVFTQRFVHFELIFNSWQLYINEQGSVCMYLRESKAACCNVCML